MASLTEIDRNLIALVVAQRVLSASHLEQVLAPVPPRTLRYRTARLARLGLLGRSRPYRDRGSAPFYYWPTRAADTYARGEVAPGGGERAEPNPLFLAHAAGLSDLYVGLLGGGAPGIRPAAFHREEEAREPFRARGNPRALAPDARLELRTAADDLLLAHVELDRGTMSHPRLKHKAALYIAYVAGEAWRSRYPFCPALLFITTTEARAAAFLAALGALARRELRGLDAEFTPAACAMASEPGRALGERCWRVPDGRTAQTLAECLQAARAPYDRARAADRAAREARAERAARDEREAQLRADPDALRQYLRERRGPALNRWFELFGPDSGAALALMVDGSEPLTPADRRGLEEFGRIAGAGLLDLTKPPGYERQFLSHPGLDELGRAYRSSQVTAVERLLLAHGPVPCVRAAQEQLDRGGLLSPHALAALPAVARRQAALRRAEEGRGLRYDRYRERMADERAGLIGRLRRRQPSTAVQLDAELLRRCDHCQVTVYPELDETLSGLRPTRACPYCDRPLNDSSQ